MRHSTILLEKQSSEAFSPPGGGLAATCLAALLTYLVVHGFCRGAFLSGLCLAAPFVRHFRQKHALKQILSDSIPQGNLYRGGARNDTALLKGLAGLLEDQDDGESDLLRALKELVQRFCEETC